MTALVPPNAGPVERAVRAAAAAELGDLPVARVADVSDPERCPAALLPFALLSRGYRYFAAGQPVAVLRDLLRTWLATGRQSIGTTAALRRLALSPAGAVAEIEERHAGHHTIRVEIHNANELRAGIPAIRQVAEEVLPNAVHVTIVAGGGVPGALQFAGGAGGVLVGRVAEGVAA